MDVLRKAWCLVFVAAFSSNSAVASPVVIAESKLNAPLTFAENSFYPVGLRTDHAFSFEVSGGGPFLLKELQIVAYYSE